jgi:molecular chaperone GrpE
MTLLLISFSVPDRCYVESFFLDFEGQTLESLRESPGISYARSYLTSYASLRECQQYSQQKAGHVSMKEQNDDTPKEPETPTKESNESQEVSMDFDEPVLEEESGHGQTGVADEAEPVSSQESEGIKEIEDKYLRLQAEFDNYRKRMNARFEEMAQFASEGIILKVLDVVDNLERALETDFRANPEAAKDGIRAIITQVEKMFDAEQVRRIETLGKEFDPYYQNAINTVNDESLPDRTVIQEYQKGYMIRDKVLRPAMVCINRRQMAEEQPVSEEVEMDNDSTGNEKLESEGGQ